MAYKIKGDVEIGRGFGPSRMTTVQRTAYTPAAVGYMVYDTDLLATYQWDGTAWQSISSPVAKAIYHFKVTTLTGFLASSIQSFGITAAGGPTFVNDPLNKIVYNGDGANSWTLQAGRYKITADLAMDSVDAYAEFRWVDVNTSLDISSYGATRSPSFTLDGATPWTLGDSPAVGYLSVTTTMSIMMVGGLTKGTTAPSMALNRSYLTIEEI